MSETERIDLAQLKPGMEFCTFDFQRWGELTAIEEEEGNVYLVGTTDDSGVRVYVPFDEVVETHGQCIRLTQPRVDIDAAGWDQRPPVINE